ncbi:hypothetical protein M427DRAFT_305395 [Gonapodya prolifera JEL478]|uniref:C3H1-type domain-containing protein n=1 Tax=Gonapodya prolifera (strain JEL478) TaxID=1344416 RepID=A0A139AGJ8_GONPJ|nr:hypothetical protein M427DRAFT_305395 [Gonapodya prolifera JEL478]|eukprot:KXS15926.1 hypothetical protein M427DRAFT_305395 [Gonapodya prolifera JEL478]
MDPKPPRPQSKTKTELCKSWENTQSCKYGKHCLFAHGKAELRSVERPLKFKTELCKNYWRDGICNYGRRCHFIHSEDDIFRKYNDIAEGNIVLKPSRDSAVSGHARHSSVPSFPTGQEKAQLPSLTVLGQRPSHAKHARHSSYDPRAIGDAKVFATQRLAGASNGHNGTSNPSLLPPPFQSGHVRRHSAGMAGFEPIGLIIDDVDGEPHEDGGVFGLFGPQVKAHKARDEGTDSGWSEEGVLSA